MTLFRFTVNLHKRAAGSVSDVAPSDRESVQPLIDAGYLVPLYPEPRVVVVPKRHRQPEGESE